MKITLEKNNQNVVINCSADISDGQVRRLLDVLFDLAPTQQPSAEVRVEAAESAVSVEDIPTESIEYRHWLHRGPCSETLPALSELVGHDLTGQLGTVYSLVNEAPQFATNLGLWRFLITVEWLYHCGKLRYLPIRTSLQSYYTAAVRRVEQ